MSITLIAKSNAVEIVSAVIDRGKNCDPTAAEFTGKNWTFVAAVLLLTLP